MKHILKRILVITLITHLALVSSIFYNAAYSYAAVTWEDVTTNEELVEAFRYYCKSRNLTIDGSVADGITSFTTSTFNNICNTLGIDVTALQANLKKSTDSNGGLRFLFDASGISTYNRIFAEFLQNNDLAVGDSADESNNTVMTGEVFTDDDGNKCFVYSTSQNSPENLYASFNSIGTPLKYSHSNLVGLGLSNSSAEFNISGNTYSCPLYHDSNSYVWGITSTPNTRTLNNCIVYSLPHPSLGSANAYGIIGVNKSTFDNAYYLSIISDITYSVPSDYHYLNIHNIASLNPNNISNGNIYLTTNNTVINNNNYEGDTIINNEGDTGGGSEGGGSEGGGSEGDTNINVEFPHITLPDLSGIDWSLDGLASKFPFCIPFDLYHFVDVLDAEPETPKFEGSINLIVTTWDLDYDLTAFDDLAAIVRNVEFIGFCIGLIFITRKIIKG